MPDVHPGSNAMSVIRNYSALLVTSLLLAVALPAGNATAAVSFLAVGAGDGDDERRDPVGSRAELVEHSRPECHGSGVDRFHVRHGRRLIFGHERSRPGLHPARPRHWSQ